MGWFFQPLGSGPPDATDLRALYDTGPNDWGLLLCKVRGQDTLANPPAVGTAADLRAWARGWGIGIHKLALLGPTGAGKTTLLGTVDSVAKFNALALDIEGAEKGDRVHLIPQRRGGWKLALCSAKDGVLLLLDMDKQTLSMPER